MESPALRNLVQLLNPEAVKLMVKADAIADNVMRMFFQLQAHIKQLLQNDAIF